MTNEYKKVDLEILMKNNEIACVTTSIPMGTEDGEPLTQLYGIKNMEDLQSKLMTMRFDIEDFPQTKLCFHLDNQPWIQVEGKGNHPKEFPLENEIFDKYSNEERIKINISFEDTGYDNRRNAILDKSIGNYTGHDDLIESVDDITGLSELYSSLYDTMQVVENFPKGADFYIDDELFLSVNRLHTYHLEVNQDLSSSLILEHGSTNILKLKTIENDDGTFSLKNEAPEIVYSPYSESDTGCIRDNNGNTNFKTKDEGVAALTSYLSGDKEQGGRNLETLDILNVNIDGDRVGTYCNNKRIFVGNKQESKISMKPKPE